MRNPLLKHRGILPTLAAPVCILMAGCGGNVHMFSMADSTETLVVHASATTFDTGSTATLSAVMADGSEPESLHWTLSGGDKKGGTGVISSDGVYTPPTFLTADVVTVRVTAVANHDSATASTTELSITPGFQQPLSPQNVTLGPNGLTTITGVLAESGGTTGIHFALAGADENAPIGEMGQPVCSRATGAQTKLTTCSVSYTAPANLTEDAPLRILASAGNASASAHLLLRAAGTISSPLVHQERQTTLPVVLGSSGGNGGDFDSDQGNVADCCGGTLGSLVEDSSGNQYILSNNHVLAMSDQAETGDAIVQPGLIDANCSSHHTSAIASLAGWVPLNARTNTDAALARAIGGTVNRNGAILELGAQQADGSLAAAPPGISSSAGRGENTTVGMSVAKSGRTTGLTCGHIEAVALTVRVPYYTDCAETSPYLTKTFTNQISATGDGFYDAGDSGSLLVDTANAEPVGLFFAGGMDANGVSHAVATPAPEVLASLERVQLDGHAAGKLRFVGGEDHAVSCLSYGSSATSLAQSHNLSTAETLRLEQALPSAQTLVNPASGVLGVAVGKSSDHAGEAAITLYQDESRSVQVPMMIDGVRTIVVPTNMHAVATSSTPLVPTSISLSTALLHSAMDTARQLAPSLLAEHSEFLGVGAGQSLDDPSKAALVIYVDRNSITTHLPVTIAGLRTHYITMDRLHVTRSFATPARPLASSQCSALSQ